MPKKGVKIKELAAEVGVTPRVIMNRCRAEGWFVQNSVTKVTAEQADIVRRWFAGRGSSGDEPDGSEHSD